LGRIPLGDASNFYPRYSRRRMTGTGLTVAIALALRTAKRLRKTTRREKAPLPFQAFANRVQLPG
jgi:hypothetical protein